MNNPSTISVALLLAALGLKITDLAKYLVALTRDEDRRRGANGIVTMAVTTVVGYLVLEFFVKKSAWGDEVTIGSEQLGQLKFGSTLLVALVFTSVASTLYDFKQAIDKKDPDPKPDLKMIAD